MHVATFPLSMAARPKDPIFAFGRFQLFPSRRLLEENGKPVQLASRAFDLLLALVERRGSIVSKPELLQLVWPDTNVEEGSLRVSMAAVRKVLGENRSERNYIRNVPGKGYCFAAPVTNMESVRRATSIRRGNIPNLVTRMIGREEFVHSMAGELSHRRLVTIVGPGGVGKTTAAVTIAQALRTDFDGHAYFVDLAPIQNPAHVVTAISSLFGLGVYSRDPMLGLAFHLNDRRTLIVLDNCEHVIEAVAEAAEALLTATPKVHVLATTREPLRAAGEWVRRLAPLKSPPRSRALSAREAIAYAAVELFVERTAASVEGFELNDANTETVCAICRQLDGIPLAIEFAASRVEEFGLAGVAGRLGDRFGLLTKGRRTALPRHRTLLNTMDWSYGLLDETESSILRRLSAFAGSFPLEAACAVAAFGAFSNSAVEDGVGSLLAKSLLSVDRDHGLDHFRMLDTTRDYGRIKLQQSVDRYIVARRHAQHCLDLLERAEAEWDDGVTERWIALYGRRIGDIRRALDWAFSPDGDPATGVELTAFSSVLWTPLALMDENRSNIERALAANRRAATPDRALDMRLLASLGTNLFHTRGHLVVERAMEAFQSSLEAAVEVSDIPHQLRAISAMSAVHLLRGDYPAAVRLERAFNNIPGGRGSHVAHRTLAHSRHYSGDFRRAAIHLREALRQTPDSEKFQTSGTQFDQRKVILRTTAARQLWLAGCFDQAMTLARECVDDAKAFDHAISLCHSLATGACPIAFAIGGRSAAAPFLKLLRETSSEHSMELWLQWSEAYELAMTPRAERRDPAAARMMEMLAEQPIAGNLLDHLATLGEDCVEDWMVRRAMGGFGGWCKPELLRAQGEMLQRQGEREIALTLFRQALALARKKGSRAWELRIATSLARHLGANGKREEGRVLLAPVQARFVEGFDSVDFRLASAVMAELS